MESLKEETRGKGIVRGIVVVVRGEVEGGKGEMDIDCTMREERIVVGEMKDVEGIDSDTRIVFEIGKWDREIEIIMELTKIGEGRKKRKSLDNR